MINIHFIALVSVVLSILFYIFRRSDQETLLSMILLILVVFIVLMINTTKNLENTPSLPDNTLASQKPPLIPTHFKYIRRYDHNRYTVINQMISDLTTLKDRIARKETNEQKQKRLFSIFLDNQNKLMEEIYSIEQILPPKHLKQLQKDTTRIHDYTVNMIKDLANVLKKRGYHIPEYGVVANNFVE